MTLDVKDSVGVGLYRLPTQFDESENLKNYLTTYLQAAQDNEQLAADVLNGLIIKNAIGVQLDNAGAIIGVKRQGRLDDDYRVAILAQAVVNASRGSPNDLISAAKSLSGSDSVRIWEHYPASVVVKVGNEDITNLPQNIAEVCDGAVSSGVRVDQVLIDTDADGLVFNEQVFEIGTIVDDLGNDLITDTGDFIGYQIETALTVGTGFFSEFQQEAFTIGGVSATINLQDWDVTLNKTDPNVGNILYEVLD